MVGTVSKEHFEMDADSKEHSERLDLLSRAADCLRQAGYRETARQVEELGDYEKNKHTFTYQFKR